MRVMSLLMIVLCFVSIAGPAYSQTTVKSVEKPVPMAPKGSHELSKNYHAVEGVLRAKLIGENICLSCVLREKGAITRANENAFKVEHAFDLSGREINVLHHKILHYLKTKKSDKLIRKMQGKRFAIRGRVYLDESVLEIKSFQMISEKKSEKDKKDAGKMKVIPGKAPLQSDKK